MDRLSSVGYLVLLLAVISHVKTEREITLDDPPHLWPGHMEPFGSKQITVEVEELDAWPSPKGKLQYYQNVFFLSPSLFRTLNIRRDSKKL